MRRDACYRLIASKADISYTVRGPGGYSTKFYTGGGGEGPLRGPTPYSYIYRFRLKLYPFRITLYVF